MLLVLSPAKSLDYESERPIKKTTKAAYLDRSEQLIKKLKKMAPQDLSKLMGISDKLGVLNYDRNQAWSLPFDKSEARQAVLAFKGDVYQGLDAYSFDKDDFEFAQQHLRILSGLYGLLKPLDAILPYRLEMGTKFGVDDADNLYQFWSDTLTKDINKQLEKTEAKVLLNLASNEYFKAINKKEIAGDIISPEFKDWKNGQYKIISFYAKKARGLMSAYVIKNRITDPNDVLDFEIDGYSYNKKISSENSPVFTRKTKD